MKLQRSGIQVAGTAAAVLAGIGLVTAVPASAATPGSWTSVQPGVAQTGCDGVRATVALDANGTLALGATWNCRQALIPAPIGLVTSQVDFTTGLEFVSRTDAPVSYNYEVTAGKSRVRTRPATETRLVFAKGSAQMTVHVRTSADGMALRYELPSGATVLREATSFELPTDAQLSRQVFSPDHERGQGVAGSNPVSPTAKGFSQVSDLRRPLFRV